MTSSAGWRYASASVVGTSHLKTETVCQDSHACVVITDDNQRPVLIAIVSDGAGSAKASQIGSALACDTIANCVSEYVERGGTLCEISRDDCARWVTEFARAIENRALEDGNASRDYACTLLGAIVGEEHAVFFQIGDGALVVSDSEGSNYGYVFWPDRGEYENTTYFATEKNAVEQLQFDSVRRCVTEIALFSDGLQRLALNYQLSTAHDPFFKGLFPAVRSQPEGKSEILCESLVQFLGSERVNARTDDDKTLILATRLSCNTTPTVWTDER
jgi:hypothetical protein